MEGEQNSTWGTLHSPMRGRAMFIGANQFSQGMPPLDIGGTQMISSPSFELDEIFQIVIRIINGSDFLKNSYLLKANPNP